MIIVKRDHIQDYLLGSLRWAGVQWDHEALSNHLPLYLEMLGRGHFHVPLYLCQDLWLMLRHGFETRFASDGEEDSSVWTPEQIVFRQRYERELLGRILQLPAVQEAIEIVRLAPDPEPLLERLLELIVGKIAPMMPREYTLNPAMMRGFAVKSERYDVYLNESQFASEIAVDDPFSAVLTATLEKVSQSMRWSELLQEEDLFELAHWEQLSTEHLRIGCRQLIEVERRLGEIDITRVSVNEPETEVETAFIDETHVPTGGVAGLTNRGSIESMVVSELAYMEDGPGINLFDLRYLEGEILYYMRDAGTLRRKRRTIHFVVDMDKLFSVKSPGFDYQFSILAQGLALRILRDVFQIFEADSVEAHFHYVAPEEQHDVLLKEVNLLEVLLEDAVKHGWVQFHFHHDLALEDLQDPKRKTYALVMAHESTPLWVERFARQGRDVNQVLGHVVEINAESTSDHASLLMEYGQPWTDIVDIKNSSVLDLVS